MREIGLTLIGVSLLAGILSILTPKAHKKYVRLLTGMCLLAVLVVPLRTLADEGLSLWQDGGGSEDWMSNYDEIYNQALMRADADCLEEWLSNMIYNKISMDRSQFSVTVSLKQNDNQWVMEKTTVLLSHSAVATDPYPIIDLIESATHAPCVIVYA